MLPHALLVLGADAGSIAVGTNSVPTEYRVIVDHHPTPVQPASSLMEARDTGALASARGHVEPLEAVVVAAVPPTSSSTAHQHNPDRAQLLLMEQLPNWVLPLAASFGIVYLLVLALTIYVCWSRRRATKQQQQLSRTAFDRDGLPVVMGPVIVEEDPVVFEDMTAPVQLKRT